MKAFNPAPARFALPLWAVVAVAGLLAAALLALFVDTLNDHIRRSAEVRQAFSRPAPHRPAAAPIEFLAAADTATPTAQAR
jgi:hypothetical protein